MATAYYLAKKHGVRNVAVLDKGWLGGGNTGRNTQVTRSNYFWPQSAAFYEHSLKLYEGLSRELNFNVMLSQRGILTLAHSHHELESLRRWANAIQVNGILANLLANSNLFAAGVACDGGYNMTLAPFTLGNIPWVNLWSDPDVYRQVSSLLHADRIRAPLLLLHGAEDDNDNTLPEQARLMYQSLKGLRKTSRLVMLRYEGHNTSIRESVLQAVWEMTDWFDRYLKPSAN